VSELNPQLKDTQFADYHGHGWNFRAIFKRDRKGNLLDAKNQPVGRRPEEVQEGGAPDLGAPGRGHAVRRLPLRQDAHGNGHIYGEVMAGRSRSTARTATAPPTSLPDPASLRPGGQARRHGHEAAAHPGRAARFEWRDGKLIQRSAVDPTWSGRCRW
jgi:hypothetical protein